MSRCTCRGPGHYGEHEPHCRLLERPKAVVLLSGGLDSTTALAIALRDNFGCHALGVDYDQRHRCELTAAERVAANAAVSLEIVRAPALGHLARSALTSAVAVPKDRSTSEMSAGIPATYVPARNTVLLGLALAYAETIGARTIYTGFNVLDASGYPDCRPEFVRAFEALAQVATAPGEPWSIRAPLIELTKAEIIRLGVSLGVDYSLTHSCYDPVWQDDTSTILQAARNVGISGPAIVASPFSVAACGRCDSCSLRKKGFAEAGVTDPTRYV